MYLWNTTEGGPCFLRPTGIYKQMQHPTNLMIIQGQNLLILLRPRPRQIDAWGALMQIGKLRLTPQEVDVKRPHLLTKMYKLEQEMLGLWVKLMIVLTQKTSTRRRDKTGIPLVGATPLPFLGKFHPFGISQLGR